MKAASIVVSSLVLLGVSPAFGDEIPAGPVGPPPAEAPTIVPSPPAPPEEPPAVQTDGAAALPQDQVGDVPPPDGAPVPDAQLASDNGQWVYTEQYGWVWMPYGNDYTEAPASDTVVGLVYVFQPVLGWGWLTAPWLSGAGPCPYFGSRAPQNYNWYRGQARAFSGRVHPIARPGYAAVVHSHPVSRVVTVRVANQSRVPSVQSHVVYRASR